MPQFLVIYVRHTKEAIWIRLGAPDTINRDEGNYYLSYPYISLYPYILIYDPLSTTATSGDRRNKRVHRLTSFLCSKCCSRTCKSINCEYLGPTLFLEKQLSIVMNRCFSEILDDLNLL